MSSIIHLGDALALNLTGGAVEVRLQDATALLRSLKAESVAAVIADPPYGIRYQPRRQQDGMTAIAGDWQFRVGPFFRDVERALCPGGAAYVFTRWDVYPSWRDAIPGGLVLKNLIVWDKGNHTSGDLAGNFGFRWEAIMFLAKGRHELRGKRHPNVWTFPRVPAARAIHLAEKPVPLLRRAIEASTDPGDLVVDPFCGSAATAVAAAECGRRAIVGDNDPRCVRAARHRLGLPLDDLPDDAPEPPAEVPKSALDLSILDGIHPEDLAELVAQIRANRRVA